MCKAEYMSMSGHPSGKYLKRVPHVWEKTKWCIFCRKGRVPRQVFWKFHSAMFVTSSQHNNVQVTITVRV